MTRQGKARQGWHGGARRGWAWPGWARHGRWGRARSGTAGSGEVGHGRHGQACLGRAGPGWAWQGKAGVARQGPAGHGAVWYGEARHGRHGKVGMARYGAVRYGRCGVVWVGKVGLVMVWQARQGKVWFGRDWHGNGKWQITQGVTVMQSAAIKQELEDLSIGGLYSPHAVLDRARDPDSVLHDYFTWDDGEAAEKYRLDQARQLIRVFVVQAVAGSKDTVRAFVSLTTDRKTGGGYRALADVLSREDLRAQMLADALIELNAFKMKYSRLSELAPILKAAEQVKRTLKRRKPRPGGEAGQAAA